MAEHHARGRKLLVWLLVLLAAVVLICAAVLADALRQEPPVPTEMSETAAARPTEQAAMATEPGTVPSETAAETTVPATEPVTQPTLPPIEDQPEELTALLEGSGNTYEDLEKLDCSQLVSVVSAGTTAKIRFYTRTDGLWTELPDLACSGYVGRSGVYERKQEGDGSTPAGLYGIGTAFYIHDEPDTALDSFRITEETYWVDDPDSVFYNQRVEGTENKDWDSAERMIGYDVYSYGFVVEYNLTAQYNAGSAIFFHIGDHPTAGCIATARDMVLAYLAQLDRQCNPQMLIACGD